jgi:hypothetical protein
MKQVTDYYFDLQNIRDIDDCSDNCDENVLIIFKQIIKSILKDNTEYDIAILDNDSELFKMSGGDGATTFPYKQFEEIMNFLFQRSKFIQEKKDDLYNSLFTVEQKNDNAVPSENVVTPPFDNTATPPVDTSVPPQVDTSVPPQVDTSVPPQVDTSVPPQVDTSVPPQVDTSVPPQVDTAVPPVVDTAATPVVDTAVPPVVDTAATPVVDTAATPVVDTAAPPVVDNNSNNPDVNTHPASNQIGGYKRMQQHLFKDITNVITVKLSVYNNSFKNSFIKKIRYSQ